MATGRTVNRYLRVYLDGYDMSGYTRNLGNIGAEWETPDLTALTDAVKGVLLNQRELSIGPYNGLLDNTATSGLHVITSGSSGAGFGHVVTAAIGVRAAPAQGDPVFCARPIQDGYAASSDGGAMAATLKFGQHDAANPIGYDKPWGVLVHANASEPSANTAAGVDDNGGASSAGGVMFWHVLGGSAGNITIKIQDAAINSNVNFSDLSGATTGSIVAATPAAGFVALSNTATVRQYLRWQIAGAAASVTFVLAFIRG